MYSRFLVFILKVLALCSAGTLLSFPARADLLCETKLKQIIAKNNLAEDSAWLRLLQFRRVKFYFASEADGPNFFISPEGHRHPDRELEAFAKYLCSGEARATNQTDIGSLPARCQFPARERWLKSYAPDLNWPTPACPKLEEWRARVHAQSATLVFSSYYPNNPSSVFGHTLLRLNRGVAGASSSEPPLLSHGVNFAANANTSNSLKFALWGLAGGFTGSFTALPYFYKVREYADFESRDIWEYDLTLTPQQVANLIDHLWELGFTNFNYYYFTENCSYHLLTAIEGAVPELELSQKIPWWVIPIDSVRAFVKTPGLVGDVKFRPSLYRQFLARYAKIDFQPEAKRAFKQIVFKGKLAGALDSVPAPERGPVLDAALDFWDFKHARELLSGSSDVAAYKQKILVMRSSEPSVAPPVMTPGSTLRPDVGHGSMRYGLTGAYNKIDRGYLNLDLRFALHDLLDRADGYPPNSTIEFFRVEMRADQNFKRARIEELKFVDILLASPITAFQTPLAWHVAIGANRERGLGCDRCLAASLLTQGGLAVNVFTERALLYGLLGADTRLAPANLPHAFVIAGRGDLGLRLRYATQVAHLTEVSWAHALGPRMKDVSQIKTTLRVSPTTDWAVDIYALQMQSRENEAGLSFYLYR